MRLCFLTTVIAAGLALCVTDVASAQRGGGRAFGGRGGSDLLGLLRMEAVQGEIELVDDQQQEIEDLQNEMMEDMRSRMSAMRDGSLDPEERRARFAELREEISAQREEYQAKIEGVLLPQQLKRLKELQVQSQFRRSGGAVGILRNDEKLAALGISDEQKEDLEKKAEQVRKKLDEKIKKLRAEAEEEVLSVLTSEQRRKFREMVGESFDFGDARDPGFGGRGGEGRGGEGRGGRGNRGQNNDS